MYPIRLQQRLPPVNIPLRAADPDIVLELQAVLDAAYAASRYDRTTDYRQPCEPPLGDDAAWADEWLKRAGRR